MQLATQTRARLEEIAQRHGFSTDAATVMLSSLVAGHGRQAQFDHPEFGGMGQWSGGGMLMIGAMFDTGLKARVDGLIGDLAGLAGSVAQDRPPAAQGGGAASPSGWPQDLGTPSSSGSQNGMDYAVFPDTRRLALRRGGQVSVYDTGDHRIGGVSQQQGGGHGLHLSSQHGPVSLESLTPVDPSGSAPSGTAAPQPAEKAPPQSAEGSIPAMIERLHDMLSRGILTQAEFDAKKADLLSRL